MSELDNYKVAHAVVKLVNGEEIICTIDKSLVENYGVYHSSTNCVTIHHPMKASVEQYFEKDEDGKVAVFEKTIMTSWVRFSYIEKVDVPCNHILLVCAPTESVVAKYDDLLLKYHTYATNPELAADLYGSIDAKDFYDDMSDDDDEDHDEEEDEEDEEEDEHYD